MMNMSLQDSVFAFLGSKWLAFVIGVGLMVALPFTWNNFSVVIASGRLSEFWLVIATFAMNVIAIVIAVYKFLSAMSNKESKPKEW